MTKDKFSNLTALSGLLTSVAVTATPAELMALSADCPACQGRGNLDIGEHGKRECPTCKGTKKAQPAGFPGKGGQTGNIFGMLFFAVALVGVVAKIGHETLVGVTTSNMRVTQKASAQNDEQLAARILTRAAVDADSDGLMEAPPARPALVGEVAPVGGGLLPEGLGLSLTDPYGRPYGFCSWDHGSVTASAGRLSGDNTPGAATQIVLAVISSGVDQEFQTRCDAYNGGPIDVLRGGDDILQTYSYAEATANSGGLWTLSATDANRAELKDQAGAANVSVDRSGGILSALALDAGTISAPAWSFDTLSIGGGLLLDTAAGTATTCGAGQAGALRLDAMKKALQICDGAGAWAELLPPTPGTDKEILFNDNGTMAAASGFYWDKDNKRLGIGVSAPAYAFHVRQESGVRDWVTEQYLNSNGSGGLVGVKARGTLAAPAAVRANDFLLMIGGRGYRATSMAATTRARIEIRAAETWTDTATGTYFAFVTTAAGTESVTEKMRLTDSGSLGVGVTAPASKLHVAGAIQPGDDAAACVPAKNGAVRYNAATLQVCIGSTWSPLLTAETDPKIGLLAAGKWCAADATGAHIVCDQLPAIGPVGQAGADGRDGVDGAPGQQGLQGPPGEAGPQGPAGEAATVAGDNMALQFNDSGTMAGAGLSWDKTAAQFFVGPIPAAGSGQDYSLRVTGDGAQAALSVERFGPTTNGGKIVFKRAGGSASSPIATPTGTSLGGVYAQAIQPDGTWQGDTDTEGRLDFYLAGSGATATDMGTGFRIRLKPNGATSGVTRFQIGEDGTGTATTPAYSFQRIEDTATGINLIMRRARGTTSAFAALQANDVIGSLVWSGRSAAGYSGTTNGTADALIQVQLVGTAATSSNMATAMRFFTKADGSTSPAERLRIASDGAVGVGVTVPRSALHVAGAVQPGNDAAPCAASKNGAIRYNAGLQACLGSTWENVDTQAAAKTWGRVSSTGGLGGGENVSTERTATGTYTLTYTTSIGWSNYALTVTPIGGSGAAYTAQVSATTQTGATVFCFAGGVLADCSFSFQVIAP